MRLFSHLVYPLVLFDKDEKSGGSTDKPKTTGDTPGGKDAENGGSGSEDKDKKEEKPILSELMKDPDFKKQLEEWGNSFVQDRLERDRKEREKQADKDNEKELEEQKKFETLAEQRGTKITELEGDIVNKDEKIKGLEAQIKEANSALSAYVEKLKAGVDEAVVELLSDKSPAAQLEWLVKHTANSEDGEGKEKKKPIPSTPQPGDVGEAAKKQRREMGKEEASRRYKKKW